ncbi:hypothetical protein QEH56_17395 [Pelagicoccus enzymogenes]|uniref:hypothetical protein n=1 Tax=Pelagicoccus enzymogenes TaxID=2773457 RepID=UPI002810868D|nr:hypothetical protein [Pelagicoccus enzymogenes]MDQ8199942.1 hypothetical protein [Pelagicoccus enzymogenes]
MTPLLDLATYEISPASRDEIVREFFPRLAAVRDEVEFDLAFWCLAQRLAVDTEELLRQLGERWLKRSGLLKEVLQGSESGRAGHALGDLISRFGDDCDAPLPGLGDFCVEVAVVDADRVKVACRGARRCCSFLEGMARALCEAFGLQLRYIRQPKRATQVMITFNCMAVG